MNLLATLASAVLVLLRLCCLAADERVSILLYDHSHGLENEYIDRQILSDIADCYYNHDYIVSYSDAVRDIDASQIEYVAIDDEPVVQLLNFMSNHNINRINVLSECLETLDQRSSLFVESRTDDAAPGGGNTRHNVNIGIVLQYIAKDLFDFIQNQVGIAVEYANWRPSAMHLGWRCIQKVYMVNNNVGSSFRFKAEPSQGSIYTLVVPLANHVRPDVVTYYFRYGTTPRLSKYDLVDNSGLLFSSASEHTTGRLTSGSQSVLCLELWPYEDVLNIHDKRPEPFLSNSSRHMYEPKVPRLRRMAYMEQRYIEDKKDRYRRSHANSSIVSSAFSPGSSSRKALDLRAQLSRRQAAHREQLALQQAALRQKSFFAGTAMGLTVGFFVPWLLGYLAGTDVQRPIKTGGTSSSGAPGRSRQRA